jgi:hypothetical protein
VFDIRRAGAETVKDRLKKLAVVADKTITIDIDVDTGIR